MTGRNNTDRPFYPLCPARSIRSSRPVARNPSYTQNLSTAAFHGPTFKGKCVPLHKRCSRANLRIRNFILNRFYFNFYFNQRTQILAEMRWWNKSNLISRYFWNIVDEGLETYDKVAASLEEDIFYSVHNFYFNQRIQILIETRLWNKSYY